MTQDELEEFLSIARVSFAAVNRVMIHGAESGEDDKLRLARLNRWGRTFSDVDFETAKRCLDAMHRGDAGHEDRLQHLNQWADYFPAFVRKWCQTHKPLATPTWRYQGEDEGPRYQCGKCLDRGYLMVLNAAFMDEHWHQIDNNRLCPISIDDRAQWEECRRWYLDGKAWCRSKGKGPLEGAVICDCAGNVATKKRADRERNGMAVYNPKTMPKLLGSGHLYARETAEKFIDENTVEGDPSARFAWDGSPPMLEYQP